MEISPEKEAIMIEALVEMLSLRLITIKGTTIISPVIKLIINLIISEIIINDQKFLAEDRKNSEKVKLLLSFLKQLNRPPARKIFITNPTKSKKYSPVEKNETITFKADPRSVKSSVLKPSASFSVIMLLPNADFNAPLRGIASVETRISVKNHVIKIPLHDLSEVLVPDIKDLRIFIEF
jgi:hypothetical protein